MGTKLETIPLGLECLVWNPADETPEAIYAMFFDMQKGNNPGAKEPPNQHIFRLAQNPRVPCDYDYENAAFDWEINLNIQAGSIAIDLRESVVPNKIYFLDSTGPPPLPENFMFTNFYQTPVNNYGWSGFCIVFWMNSVLAVADSLGLLDVPDLFFELFPAEPPNFVIKFCSLSLRINTRVLVPT